MLTTAGRIVVYCQPDAEIPINGINTHPAVITRVHDNDCVNLTVFFDNKSPEPRSSTVFVAALSTEALGGGYWKWPDRVPEDETVEAAEDESPPMTEAQVAGMPADQGGTPDEDGDPNVDTGGTDPQPTPPEAPSQPAAPPPQQPEGQAAGAPVGEANAAADDGSAEDTTTA